MAGPGRTTELAMVVTMPSSCRAGRLLGHSEERLAFSTMPVASAVPGAGCWRCAPRGLLRSAEPAPATSAQRAEHTMTAGEETREIGQWIKDLAAGRAQGHLRPGKPVPAQPEHPSQLAAEPGLA